MSPSFMPGEANPRREKMFKRWFGKKPKPEPIYPYKVGDITSYKKGIDFQVESLGTTAQREPYPTLISWQWEARGKAIVHLPKGSTKVYILEIVDQNGNVTGFSVHYASRGDSKNHAIVVDSPRIAWDREKVGWQKCYLAVDSVVTEIEKS
jgi:hypothetical protein